MFERDILNSELRRLNLSGQRSPFPSRLHKVKELNDTLYEQVDESVKLNAQSRLRDRYFNSNGEEYNDDQLAASLNGLTIANNQNVWVFDINQQIKTPIQLLNPDGTAIKFPDFLGMAQLICGESGGLSEGFLYTAHTIRNLQELREHGKNTPGLTANAKKLFKSGLREVLLSNLGGSSYESIEKYGSLTKWSSRSANIKQAALASAIASLSRSKSHEGDGGLLDGNWHSDDPTRGAIQWKGSKQKFKPGNKFSSRQAFEDLYKNKIVEFGVKKWDTDGRFFYYSNGVGAIFQKATQPWINKYAKKAGGGRIYQESILRSRGAL